MPPDSAVLDEREFGSDRSAASCVPYRPRCPSLAFNYPWGEVAQPVAAVCQRCGRARAGAAVTRLALEHAQSPLPPSVADGGPV